MRERMKDILVEGLLCVGDEATKLCEHVLLLLKLIEIGVMEIVFVHMKITTTRYGSFQERSCLQNSLIDSRYRLAATGRW